MCGQLGDTGRSITVYGDSSNTVSYPCSKASQTSGGEEETGDGKTEGSHREEVTEATQNGEDDPRTAAHSSYCWNNNNISV